MGETSLTEPGQGIVLVLHNVHIHPWKLICSVLQHVYFLKVKTGYFFFFNQQIVIFFPLRYLDILCCPFNLFFCRLLGDLGKSRTPDLCFRRKLSGRYPDVWEYHPRMGPLLNKSKVIYIFFISVCCERLLCLNMHIHFGPHMKYYSFYEWSFTFPQSSFFYFCDGRCREKIPGLMLQLGIGGR